ncbi:hypothetical protein HOH10_03900, partial [Candidatus Woesearchaeota archaeon]|nr:hypothetical protein [Candidatus Woesearchaeota archaeon]
EAILTITLLLTAAFVFSGFDSDLTGMQGLSAQNKHNNLKKEKLCECPVAKSSPFFLASDCEPDACGGHCTSLEGSGDKSELIAHKCVKESRRNPRESCSCSEGIVNIPPADIDGGGTRETIVGCETDEALFCKNSRCKITTIVKDNEGYVISTRSSFSGKCVGT